MTNMGMASVRKVHPLFLLPIFTNNKKRVHHKLMTHPRLIILINVGLEC